MTMTTSWLHDRPYLPGLSMMEYADLARTRFPWLAETLWLDRPGAEAAWHRLADAGNEFEDDIDLGRGASYRRAQRSAMVRARGIQSLFTLAAGVATPARIPRDWRLLDVLGGDGLLARVLRTVAPQVVPLAITSDMAGHMVLEALRSGLPAIRQLAQFLFVRDETMDAVIIAYGTHHIGPEERTAACQEAARVLRPGGRLVLHDFEEGSPVARWFTEVVHRHSRSGHPYTHFSAPEMECLMTAANLRLVGVRPVYDPLVFEGEDPGEVRAALADYLLDMYGLVGLAGRARAEGHDAVWALARKYFRYPDGATLEGPVVYQRHSTWLAEVPRVALVAVGEK
jgi:ubiquinone/menaquinone biosynthesis C-methylase UbiE